MTQSQKGLLEVALGQQVEHSHHLVDRALLRRVRDVGMIRLAGRDPQEVPVLRHEHTLFLSNERQQVLIISPEQSGLCNCENINAPLPKTAGNGFCNVLVGEIANRRAHPNPALRPRFSSSSDGVCSRCRRTNAIPSCID